MEGNIRDMNEIDPIDQAQWRLEGRCLKCGSDNMRKPFAFENIFRETTHPEKVCVDCILRRLRELKKDE